MPDPALVLGATAVIGYGLRVAGLAIGGRLPADHPALAWAGAVSLATVAAFVVLAVLAPGGLLAQVPLSARLAGLAAGCLAHACAGGRLLPALGAGAAVLGLAWQVAG